MLELLLVIWGSKSPYFVLPWQDCRSLFVFVWIWSYRVSTVTFNWFLGLINSEVYHAYRMFRSDTDSNRHGEKWYIWFFPVPFYGSRWKKKSWSLDTFTSMERARLSCPMCSARSYKTCCMSARTTINFATVVIDLTALERSSSSRVWTASLLSISDMAVLAALDQKWRTLKVLVIWCIGQSVIWQLSV
jgi:hypothetical protein